MRRIWDFILRLFGAGPERKKLREKNVRKSAIEDRGYGAMIGITELAQKQDRPLTAKEQEFIEAWQSILHLGEVPMAAPTKYRRLEAGEEAALVATIEERSRISAAKDGH